jgi:MFS family permease
MVGLLAPFALAHFVSYLFRSVNVVIYPDLVRDVGLSANSLGLLTGAYFIAFAAAQLPVGIALDRYGPRRVQVPMLALAACGGFLFSQATSLEGLVLARGLIGFGVGASLMAAIKTSSLWLPPERLPMVTALLLSCGGLGGMAATAPMQWAIDQTDWRVAFVGMGLAAAAISVLIFTKVPEHPKRPAAISLPAMLKSIGQLYTDRLFWRMVLCTLFTNGGYMAVQGLWLGPWLRDVGHLPRAEVAQTLFICAMAMVAGSLFFGWVTDRLQRLGVKAIAVCTFGVAAFLLCHGLMLLENGPPAWALALGFSFFGTAGAMNYAIIAQRVPPQLTGRASTCFNLLIFIVAFALQWGLGIIIDQWPSTAGSYPVAAYQVAFGVSVALQLTGLALCLSFKPWQLDTTLKKDFV